jgi:hypothetical protein
MTEGKKFNPVITRVKLNPEQTVLACCSVAGRKGLLNKGLQCNKASCTTQSRATLS